MGNVRFGLLSMCKEFEESYSSQSFNIVCAIRTYVFVALIKINFQSLNLKTLKDVFIRIMYDKKRHKTYIKLRKRFHSISGNIV